MRFKSHAFGLAALSLALGAPASADRETGAYRACLASCRAVGNSYGFCYQECYKIYGGGRDRSIGVPTAYIYPDL